MMIKLLIIFLFLIGCDQANEIQQEPKFKITKVREASISGAGLYYFNLEHAECYSMYDGGMHCRWKKKNDVSY